MTRLTWITSALIASLIAGCGPGGASVPAPEPEPVAEVVANYNAVFDAARDTLADYRFQIDRIDRRAGTVETFPMTGRGWLEPWRSDGATMRDISESTLQTIHRTAQVRIVRTGDDTYGVRVRVAVSRADRPSLQITNTSQAYQLFQLKRGRRKTQRVLDRRGRRHDPVPLDDDLVLAMFIRRDIEQRLADR